MSVRAFVLLTVILATSVGAADWREVWDRAPREKWFAKSERELESAAKGGDVVAMWVLGNKLYRAGNYREAANWKEKAAAAKFAPVVTEEAEYQQEGKLRTKFELLEASVATGYPYAKLLLAQLLLGGASDSSDFLVKANPARAVELLQQAVDERCVPAWTLLAQSYACGVGEPRSADENPVNLFARAANSEDEAAMMELAQRRRIGFGLEKDLLTAATWAARERIRHVPRILAGYVPKPGDWLQYRGGDSEDDSVLRKICELYDKALLGGSAGVLVEVAEMNSAGKNGKPNLPLAAALFNPTWRIGGEKQRKYLKIKAGIS